MKIIPLSKGKVTIVDDEDYEMLMQNKWQALCPAGYQWYAVCHRRNQNPTRPYMHRLLMGFPDAIIDHINGDGLDNRKENLRCATSSQNNANSVMNRRNKSGFKGVFFNAYHKKWQARVGRDGRYLGRFNTAEEAAESYWKESKLVFGEFARPSPVVVPAELVFEKKH